MTRADELKAAADAERSARVARKRQEALNPPSFVVLVRDGITGKPKFTNDPKEFAPEVREAYQTLMTPDEIKEHFE